MTLLLPGRLAHPRTRLQCLQLLAQNFLLPFLDLRDERVEGLKALAVKLFHRALRLLLLEQL